MMELRILMVDDEADVLEIVRLMLEKEGHQFLSAQSGQEGLRTVYEEKVDLILLDLRMPGMSGKDFLELLRRTPSTADIPTIIFTALKPEQAEDECMAMGANGFVHKPFAKKILLREIERVMEEAYSKLQ